ncbi:lysozyme family protein [Modicisalibacter xianhensis]|uniref:Lysozyme family protein n=1 Tax=Modicisalibacter xianhensis TaxID=442341 RepID=A0A4R8FDM4_9GAMM|nr:peptidoglycan-binding protein [Halomonas xianhensis]TDX23829.1 lysozyme family protein [Halomonas xianhensis]
MSEALNYLYNLIIQTNEALEHAKKIGDQASAAELESFLATQRSAAAKLTLINLAEAAAELSELVTSLERSEREMSEATRSFFLGDLGEIRFGIEKAAAELYEQVDPSKAVEASDDSFSTISMDVVPPPKEPAEYVACFEALEFRPTWREKADALIAKITREDAIIRYLRVEEKTKVPWWFVGVLHIMETSQRFNAHLHNGDPLSAKTVRVPSGRPINWQAGMPWELSAADALMNGSLRLHEVRDWSLGNTLMLMEHYNGFGYRKLNRMSPYLWNGSYYCYKGKFVSDSQFNPEAISEQVGGALLIHRLKDMEFISISSMSKVNSKPPPTLVSTKVVDKTSPLFKHAAAELNFPLVENYNICMGMGGPKRKAKERMAVQRIQEWCCIHGCRTSIDGDFGPSTKTAVKLFQQRNNLQITGEVGHLTWSVLTAPMQYAITPVEHNGSLNSALLAVANQHIKYVPREVGGNNCGPWVRLYMEGKDGEIQRWCAGFVCTLVLQAAYNLGGAMPFARQVSVDALVKDAKNSGRFVAETSLADPVTRRSKIVPGSLFVIRKSTTDWTHVGIVTEVRDDHFLTIEGNTNGDNIDGGNAIFSTRGFTRRDFLLLT